MLVTCTTPPDRWNQNFYAKSQRSVDFSRLSSSDNGYWRMNGWPKLVEHSQLFSECEVVSYSFDLVFSQGFWCLVHLFMYFHWSLCISVPKTLPPYIGLSYCLKSSLYILDISLYQIYVLQVFSPILYLSLFLFGGAFFKNKCFKFWLSPMYLFFLCSLYSSRNHVRKPPSPGQSHWRLFSKFF